jgi:nucleotide-binding universal stress UspA family protein
MRSILVAVDDSPRARPVLEAGIDMARQTGSRIRLLRVVGVPRDLAPVEWAAPPTQVINGLIETAKRDLGELARLIPDGLTEAVTTQVGIAWDVICAHAAEHDCDLIVIGSPGHGFLERLVGTTAAKVVNHADRAILVVPARSGHAAARHAS